MNKAQATPRLCYTGQHALIDHSALHCPLRQNAHQRTDELQGMQCPPLVNGEPGHATCAQRAVSGSGGECLPVFRPPLVAHARGLCEYEKYE